MYRKVCTIMLTSAALALVFPATASAQTEPLSGAIFTTDVTGVPVNLNIYDAKQDVYLNGGPGINAPDDAAGLPAGTYSFQVTSPSGKTLLSTDPVSCRQFTVDASGRIQQRRAGRGLRARDRHRRRGPRHNRPTVPVRRHPEQRRRLQGLGDAYGAPRLRRTGNKHCFVPGDSKTDNFKVKEGADRRDRHPVLGPRPG